MTSPLKLLDYKFRAALKNGLEPDTARKWQRDWFDLAQVRPQLKLLEQAPHGSLSSQERRVLTVLRRLVAQERCSRSVGEPPPSHALSGLKTSHPNFREVVEHVQAQLALMRTRHAGPRRIQPMLLLGDPGIGKTSFAQALARAMQVACRVVAMNTATAGFSLSGLDRGWASGREGLVFSVLEESATLNPLIMLDEVDKALSNEKSEPLAPLYQLLEAHTAREFRDEFLEVTVNASFVTWVATANRSDTLPAPLLDRLRVFEIQPPDCLQMELIACNQYAALREDIPALAPGLCPRVLQSLVQRTPRDCQAALQVAAGHAAVRADLSGSDEVSLTLDDLPPAVRCMQSMGFV